MNGAPDKRSLEDGPRRDTPRFELRASGSDAAALREDGPRRDAPRCEGPRRAVGGATLARRLSAGARLYKLLLSASARAKMQYKLDFVASTVIQAAMGAYDYLFTAAILWRFKTIAGWDIYDFGLLYGVSRIGWGLYRVFFEEVDRFEGYIVRGDFDSILIRPWPSLFVLASRNLELSRLSWVLQGASILAVSARHLLAAGVLTWVSMVHLALASIWTGCLYAAVSIATSAAAFAIVRIEELQVFTQNATGSAALYPLDIFPNWLKYLLLTAIPLGVGNYIPVKYLLGKGGTWMNLLLPAVASATGVAVALKLWRLGETRYHSTGS